MTRIFPLLIVAALLCLPLAFADVPLVEDTGTITVDNTNGEFSASMSPSNSISVTFNPLESTSVSGGGGGGGGGSETPNACMLTNPSTSHTYDVMETGRTYTLSTRSGAFLLRTITFSLTEAPSEPAVFVATHLLNIACELTPPLSSEEVALAYERLDYTGVYRNQIVPGVNITFAVPRANLTARSADPADVRLMRYDGQNWNPLPTTLVNETSSELTYVAVSPGLSVFAVSFPAPAAPVTPTTTPTTPEAGGGLTGAVTEELGGAASGGATSGTGSSDSSGAATGSAKKRGFPLLSILIVVILGAMLGGYYVYSQRRDAATATTVIEATEPVERTQPFGFATIPDEALVDPVDRLRAYVDKELRCGLHRDAIASQLRRTGWPENIISSVLDDLSPRYLASRGMHEPHADYDRVTEFLKEKLERGYDVAVIKSSLGKVGWDAALIESLLRDLQRDRAAETAAYSAEALAKLRAFIETELKRGHRKEQIRAALVNVGWQERAVDDELEKR